MSSKLIYIVDDEQNIRDLIKSYLIKDGFSIEAFADGSLAFAAFLKKQPDMLIIDIMMPEMDGYTLCKEIRKVSDVPIIMVSAKDDEIDRILGLELGGDDYISKPFSPRELVTRVKTIFRRMSKMDISREQVTEQNKIVCSDITILFDERRAICGLIEIEFTTKEFEFITYLAKNKNRVFTREQLINLIWGYEYIGDTRSIDDLVKRVRKKLIAANSKLEITTVWGYGYKIVE